MAFPSTVTFALGSNLGNRENNIKVALNMLDIALGSHYAALSPVVETSAIGFDGADFLNCVVRYSSCKSPSTILAICKHIEQQMGRTDTPEYAEDGSRIYHDRIIDIDILTYGQRKIHTEELVIPHPQVESRPYIKELLLHL